MKEITLKGMLDAWSRFPEISGFCPCSRKRAYVENATTAMNAARCITTGCANFGSANNGGKCNKCTGYKRTVVDAYVAPVPHVEAAPPAVKSTPTPTEMHHPGELEWYSPCYDRYVDTCFCIESTSNHLRRVTRSNYTPPPCRDPIQIQ